MNSSYFTPEKAMHRLFYLQGETSDEFYTDSGMCVNLDWLLYRELQRQGYEQIIYYDETWKMYCYDDRSLDYLTGKKGQEEETPPAPVRVAVKNRGLRMGKWGKKASPAERIPEKETAGKEELSAGLYGEGRGRGKASGLSMVSLPDTPLHTGMKDNRMVFRQIDACMRDASIKTAVVMVDASDFINRLGSSPDWANSLAGYQKLPASNENILVFIFPKKNMLSLLSINQLNLQEIVRPENVIDITCPNALEIRNMLNYFRLFPGKGRDGKSVRLKIRVREIEEIALEIKRYMAEDADDPVDMKGLYHKLMRFQASGEELTADNCHRLFERNRHKTGEELLGELIGMEDVKEAVNRFRKKTADPSARLRYLTSSRILPDLPVPENKDLMHVVLTGPPGTGKTTVAKLLGQIYYEMGYLSSGHVVETDRGGLVGEYIGSTAVKTQTKVKEAMGGVLFVDEAYSLIRSDDSSDQDFGREAVDTLVKAMDEYKGQFILVAAGYQKEMERFLRANSGLASRFRLILHLKPYTPEEMQKILEKMTRSRGLIFSESFRKKLPDFCENWVNLAGEEWGNGREAEKLSAELELNWLNDPHGQMQETDGAWLKVLEERHLPEDLRGNLKPVAQLRAQVMERLNSLTGLDYVKQQVQKIQRGMKVGDTQEPGHYIFSGPPGTGKTTVARIMGQILRNHGLLTRGHTVEYTASSLKNEIYSGKSFEEIARRAIGGVLFIDEAHQLLEDAAGQGIIRSMVPFMEENRKELCVICAGYADEMERFLDFDPGLKNRFKENLLFENYSGEELQKILLAMLEQEGFRWDEDYAEKSLRALVRYVKIHEKDQKFGNARYLRSRYIPDSKDARNKRLLKTYGEEIPESEKKFLTGADIPADLVKYTMEKLPPKDTRTAMEIIEDLIGYEDIKRELRKLLESARYRSADGSGAALVPETLHWVLKGNPGTGKTTIAKLVGKVYKECGLLGKGHTVKVTRSDLVAPYVGQTAPKTRRMIEKAMDGVLFIDEAYSLTKGQSEADFGSEAIDELVEAMSDRNGEFAVIAAGYPDEMDEFVQNNPGMFSRCRQFILNDYTGPELHQILVRKCRDAQMEISPELDEKLDGFFENYKNRESRRRQWANGREAENLLREMQRRWFENQVTERDEEGSIRRIFMEEHIPEDLRRYLKGTGKQKSVKSAMERLQSMAGFGEVKNYLENLRALSSRSRELNIEELLDGVNLHCVLLGNPGTGKTTAAELIGSIYKEIGILPRGHCVKVTRADLVAEHVGGTMPKTKKCIERAMGGVLFIDEAYTLKRSEGMNGDSYGQEAIDAIMEAMSARNGEFAVVVAGYPREMDIFLKSNPGLSSRFSGQIFRMEDYTASELVQIFGLICEKGGFRVSQELQGDLEQIFDGMLAHRTKEWGNGREAENLERKMRSEWVRHPLVVEEDGERILQYGREHIPAAYRRYQEGADAEEKEKKEKKDTSHTGLEKKIPEETLPETYPEFHFDSARKNQESGVALIKCEVLENGRRGTSYGSGFLMTSDGFVVTCRHVVEHADSIQVRFRIPGRAAGEVSWHKARVSYISEKFDAALLKVDVMQYPCIPMRKPEHEIQIGEEIYLIAYPFGAELSDDENQLDCSVFQGYVSSRQVFRGTERIYTDMAAKRGCSGGPVFSRKDGTIVGILCGSHIKGDEELKEEINFILPVRYIWEEMIRRKSS